MSRRFGRGLVAGLGLIIAAAGFALAAERGEDLRDAALAGSTDKVRQLLDAGTPVDSKAPRHGQTPLLIAAWRGRLEVVRLLVERGADVNAKEESTARPRLPTPSTPPSRPAIWSWRERHSPPSASSRSS